MKRIVTALGTAALALALVLPSAQAANHSTTTTSATLFASSLNCQYQEQPDCVNVVTSITQDSTGAALFCVGIGDFHEVHPPLANGCVTLSPGQLIVDEAGAVVPTIEVPAVYTTDCLRTEPEDACVPRSLVMTASASFTAVGSPESYRDARRESTGQCTTAHTVRGTRVNLVGSVTIDGFAYDLSGTDPSLHHFEAWLTTETVRSKTRCGNRGFASSPAGEELLSGAAAE